VNDKSRLLDFYFSGSQISVFNSSAFRKRALHCSSVSFSFLCCTSFAAFEYLFEKKNLLQDYCVYFPPLHFNNFTIVSIALITLIFYSILKVLIVFIPKVFLVPTLLKNLRMTCAIALRYELN